MVSIGVAISEMFLQIEMEEENKPFHRVLMLDDPDKIVELEGERHPFGSA